MATFNPAFLANAAKNALSQRIAPAAAANRVLNAVKVNYDGGEIYDNSAAKTPPMGWSSWNLFRNKISEELILEIGRALKDSGLADLGYVYLNIDDCWQSSMRDENGRLQGDLITFPSGIAELVKKANALGLKVGIYSSNGTLTCEDLPASLGHEALDAATFAEWGIEYFKYDFCHNVPIPSKAPDFEAISVSRGGSSSEKLYTVDTAFLGGGARIIDDNKFSTGKYVTGLSGDGGYIEFTEVEAPEDGEYVLTFRLRKKSNSNKYAEIIVNSEDTYSILVPATHAPSAEGRHQVKIKLRKGLNTIKVYNPVGSRMDSAAIQYTNMGRELKKATAARASETGEAEKPIVFSICEWGLNMPWKWGNKAGNLWRTTPDIRPYWASIVAIYEFNVNLYKNAGPGNWNDPDMLEVGNGKLTFEENKSHFSLWCMMAAPLILGNDIRKFISEDGSVNTEDRVYCILSNKDAIAVDQDSLGVQCRRIKTNGFCDVLLKPLDGSRCAVCFFNKGSSAAKMEHGIKDIVCRSFVSLPFADRYKCFDVWDKSETLVTNTISASVPPHGVKMYILEAVK